MVEQLISGRNIICLTTISGMNTVHRAQHDHFYVVYLSQKLENTMCSDTHFELSIHAFHRPNQTMSQRLLTTWKASLCMASSMSKGRRSPVLGSDTVPVIRRSF